MGERLEQGMRHQGKWLRDRIQCQSVMPLQKQYVLRNGSSFPYPFLLLTLDSLGSHCPCLSSSSPYIATAYT